MGMGGGKVTKEKPLKGSVRFITKKDVTIRGDSRSMGSDPRFKSVLGWLEENGFQQSASNHSNNGASNEKHFSIVDFSGDYDVHDGTYMSRVSATARTRNHGFNPSSSRRWADSYVEVDVSYSPNKPDMGHTVEGVPEGLLRVMGDDFELVR